MSVRDRMQQLQEEMDERFPAKIEIKTVREWLARDGYAPPDDPSDVSTELHRLFDHLSAIGMFVEFGDHLSDGELYAWILPYLDGHMSLTGGDVHMNVLERDEDQREHLTYYATDQERARWKERFCDAQLPPKKEPQYRRDD
jgi:hypothetical protein